MSIVKGRYDFENLVVPDTRDLYVDLAGDDDATGTVGDPIRSIFEAGKRTQQPAGLWQVFLGDGYHELRDVFADFGGDTNIRNRFAAYHPISLFGLNQTTGTAITILSYVDNVATISETLGVNDLAGQHVDHLLFGSLAWRSYILSNTASTITFMDNLIAWGSFFDSIPPVGVQTVTTNAAVIVQPVTNPDEYENQLYLSGLTSMDDITVFHGTPGFDIPAINVAYGSGGGNKLNSGGAFVALTNVWIRGANKSIHVHGAGMELAHVFMDGEVGGTGFQAEMGGNLTTFNVHCQGSDTMFVIGADFIAEVGAADALYTPGVNDVFKVRKGGNLSINMGFNYTTSGTSRFCDMQGDLGVITFGAGAIAGFQQQGATSYSSIFFGDVGRKLSLYGLSGAATAAPIGTPVYVGMDGESFTLAEWIALGGTSIETTNGSRVTEG